MDKRGDIGGWIGASIGSTTWILVASGLLLTRGQIAQGLTGVALFGIAVTVCFLTAPWKNPNTPYWKLMLAMYCTPAVAIVWAVWVFGAKEIGLTPMTFLTLLGAVLGPLWLIGRRRWSDSIPSEDP